MRQQLTTLSWISAAHSTTSTTPGKSARKPFRLIRPNDFILEVQSRCFRAYVPMSIC